MPTVDFTLEDLKRVFDERLNERLNERFIAEREHTRKLIHEEVQDQFHSFTKHTFQPFIDHVDERFERLEDRVDHLANGVSELRIDTRHLKQALRAHSLNPASDN